MMKKSYIFFALILNNLLGQSFTGLVKDISGEPIPYVIVEEVNSNVDKKNWAITDFNGVFTINASNTAKLSFERIGFKKTSLAINEIKGKSIVLLSEDIALDAVDVYGSNNDQYLKNKTSLNSLGSYSRGGSLNHIPSLEMRTYGGYAGVSSASFDGGFARHTKVLFNGVDLTDAMNGQVDLSTLPSFALKSVNYRLNSGTKYGSGSIDGSLNINNNVTENNVFFSVGDYGFSQYGANYSINRSTSKRNIMFGKTSYDGDYKFAGTADAVINSTENKIKLLDFKQSNRPKRREYSVITEYGHQLALYSIAHDKMFGTNIESTEILMCTPNLMFQNFEFKGEEFQNLKKEAMNRVEQYYLKKKNNSL